MLLKSALVSALGGGHPEQMYNSWASNIRGDCTSAKNLPADVDQDDSVSGQQ
jgi:hypothetical protein